MQVLEAIVSFEDINEFLGQIDEISSEYGVAIQALDAEYIVGEAHLEQAVRLADRAFDRGENIARERGVEILLYAAGTRQIDVALELGVEAGSQPAVIVAHGRNRREEAEALDTVSRLDAVEPADTLGGFDEQRVQSWFEIGEAELASTDATLAELVCERVALLTVEK